MKLALAILFCSSLFAAAAVPDIIDSSRRVVWQGNVGVVGGIPDSATMTVFSNISAGASLPTVQAAIDSCPSNQVVALAAGSYSWSANGDSLFLRKDGVVLRGAGMNLTFITLGVTSTERIQFNKQNEDDAQFQTDANLSVDAVKGATTVTLASVPSWVTAGELIGIDQTDDSAFASNSGIDPGNSIRTAQGQGTRGFGQVSKVVSKTGTTITLETPLFYGFDTAHTAQIFRPGYDPSTQRTVKRAGLENVMLTYLGSGGISDHGVSLQLADSCWIKNCGITNTYGGSSIWSAMAYRCEFRGNLIHDSHLYGGGQGYGVALYYYTSSCLVEDNILYHLHNPLTADGSSGNAYTYNYEFGGYTGASTAHPAMNTHLTHSYGNIWEGNYAQDGVDWDWTHGSGSHNTAFRNRVVGTNGAAQSASRVCAMVFYYQRYNNIVGNILGTAGYHDKRVMHQGSQGNGSQGEIFRFGAWDLEGGDWSSYDAYSYTSGMFILDHGNWDVTTTTNNGIVWNASVTNHTLANSYVYGSKPSFFGLLSWPPFDPAIPYSGTNFMAFTNIPAGWRYAYGTNPPSLVPTGLTVTMVAAFGRAGVGRP